LPQYFQQSLGTMAYNVPAVYEVGGGI